jgi:hypothetical protein
MEDPVIWYVTGWDGMRKEDDNHKENIGMLINLF